jgi:hypothetical protein
MSRLQTRLRKLEAQLTDRSRLVPHTPQWFDYWMVRADKLVNGEPVEEKIPFEFLDVLVKRADAAEGGAPA